MAAKVVLAALSHIWATLEPTGCSCALMGGLSLSFWRHVRSTQDVDLLVAGVFRPRGRWSGILPTGREQGQQQSQTENPPKARPRQGTGRLTLHNHGQPPS